MKSSGSLTQNRVAPVVLSSPHDKWQELGTITSQQAYPGVSDRDYTTVAALAAAKVIEWEIPNWARKVQLAFQTTADANSTTLQLMGFASQKKYAEDDTLSLDDDALYLGQLALTGGKQVASHSNFYVDTVVATDGVCSFSVLDSGNDRVCIVEFNAKGLDRIVFVASTLHADSTLYVQGRLFE